MHEHFEVGEADIGISEQLLQTDEAVLTEDRQLAGNHGVAAGDQRQVARLRFVQHSLHLMKADTQWTG